MKKKRKYLLSKPAGPSQLPWNNTSTRTSRAVTCELCGKNWPAHDDGNTIINFLGFQIVGECCGKVLDIVYRESVEEFVEFFLRDFAEDPSNPKFHMFLHAYLPDALGKAGSRLYKTSAGIYKVRQLLPIKTK